MVPAGNAQLTSTELRVAGTTTSDMAVGEQRFINLYLCDRNRNNRQETACTKNKKTLKHRKNIANLQAIAAHKL